MSVKRVIELTEEQWNNHKWWCDLWHRKFDELPLALDPKWMPVCAHYTKEIDGKWYCEGECIIRNKVETEIFLDDCIKCPVFIGNKKG